MAKRSIDRKYLIELRKKTGLNQLDFAELVGVPVRRLRSYERAERLLTPEQFQEIKSALGYRSEATGKLRVMIDYLRITFKRVTDLDFFCRKYLYCPLSDFTSHEKNMMMYTHVWRRGDIWIFDYADKTQTDNYQITLQLSGAGCRQFELVMEQVGITWIDFLQTMYFEREDMKVTRLDIAMDEMYQGHELEMEQIRLSDIISKVYHDEVRFDRLKTWNHIGGGQLLKKDGTDETSNQGISIYFGSRQSNLYFNFYEKRYELARKENISVQESLDVFGIWNRYELRLSQSKAHQVMIEYVCGVDLAEIAKGIINKEIEVYDGTNDYGAFLPDRKWQELFGGVEPIKLTVSPEPYSIERTVKWLLHQVADSLALIDEADKIMDTAYLQLILNSGEVTERGEQILSYLSPSDRQQVAAALGDTT